MGFKDFAAGDMLAEGDLDNYLMRQAVIGCTSGTRPSSPQEGMTVYETDTDRIMVYSGSAWRRYAVDLESWGPQQATDATTLSGIVSTSFAAGSPACGLAFVAPPSGYVRVTVSAALTQSSNGNETRISYEIRTGSTIGSGTVHTAASSARAYAIGRAVVTSGPSYGTGSFGPYLHSVTAGDAYNVRTMHQVSGGSGAVESRHVLIDPVL